MKISVRAISLIQPWASLWLTDRKIHETRPRRWNHSGWLAVHASRTIVDGFDDDLHRICVEEFGIGWERTLARGGVIGAVNMVSCLPTTETSPVHADDHICGNWASGRQALRRTDFIKLPEMIPCRGNQILFDLPDDIGKLVLAALEST